MSTTHFKSIAMEGESVTPDSTAVIVTEYDSNGDVEKASGSTVPTDAEAGYAHGCTFTDTNGGVGAVLYVNEGSNTSCDFNIIAAGSSWVTLSDTPGSITANTYYKGNAGGTALEAGIVMGTTTATSGNVLVANGTSFNTSTPDSAGLVAKTGNQTIVGEKTFSNAGVFSSTLGISGAATMSSTTALNGAVTVGTNNKVNFRNGSTYIQSPSDTELDIVSTGDLVLSTKDYAFTATGTVTETITGTVGITSSDVMTITGAGVILESTGASAGDFTITAGDVFTVDSVDSVNINSSAGVINIGSDDIDQNINLGTAGERTVTIGSTSGATALDMRAGTGNITMYGVAATTLTLGKSDQTGTMKFAESTGTLECDIATGNGNKTFNAVTGTGTNVISIGSGNATSNTIHIGDGASGVDIITIGTDNGASSLALKAGTGNFSIDGNVATTYTIGNAAQTGTMKFAESSAAMECDIATGTGAHTVHLADGTAANIVTIGSTNTTASTTIQSGTGDITLTGGAIAGTAGTGKAVSFVGGTHTTGTSGTASLASGTATGAAGISGAVSVYSGASSSGTGGVTGNVSLYTGNAAGASASGSVYIHTGTFGGGGSAGSINIAVTNPGAVNLGTHATAKVVTVCNTADTFALKGATIGLGDTASASAITLGNTTGASSVAIKSGTGDITLTGGAFAFTGGAGDGAAGKNVSIISGATNTDTSGTAALATGAATGLAGVSGAVSIYTGVANDAGSGNTGKVSIYTGASTFANSGDIDIYNGAAAGGTIGNILIGHTAPSTAINIGTHATANTTTIGNVTGTTTVAVNTGTGGMTITSPNVTASSRLTVGGIFTKTKMMYEEDFNEVAAALASTVLPNAHWTGAGTNGTQAIIAGANGILQMDTTAGANSTSTMTFTNANFNTNNAPIFEAYIKTDLLTNRKVNVGMYASANDYIQFEFNTATDAANIYLSTKNNGAAEVSEDTTVDLVANTYIKLRIDINADETFAAYINDTRVNASHAGTLRALTTFKPYFYVDNKDQAQSNKLDIDYVRIWQNR